MLSPDLGQTRRYIELLRGDADTTLCWQMFNDLDSESGYPQVFHSNIVDGLATINQYQKSGYGAYVTINPTDGKGRKLENITSYDWVFSDIDGGSSVIADYPLKPAFITMRDETHGHVYWPVSGITTERQFNHIQKLVALSLGSDEQVIDPCRVARVPGLLHLKDPKNPLMYVIGQDNSNIVNRPYQPEEFESAFKLDETQQKELVKFVSNREAKTNGSGMNEIGMYRQMMIRFVRDHAPVAIKGASRGRSYTLIQVAGYGWDHGISEKEAVDILWEHYNPRCDPPWDETEKHCFAEYVSRSYRYARNAPGCRTATGANWPKLSDPTGGREHNEKFAPEDNDEIIDFIPSVGDIGFITESEAAANKTFITNKSSVHEFAIKFIGELYPNKTLLRFENLFYAYNGKHWDATSDEFINAEIYKFFSGWKFPPSKIKNIFDALKNVAFEFGLERGIYLNDRSREPSTAIIMNNGIIDVSGPTVKLRRHDRNFFDLNMLPYYYDPSATCPEFFDFIESQWPGNHEMKLQLQEMYGLCLTPNKNHGRFALMIGKSRSGKGVHRDIITAMIGKHNICSPNLESLIEDHTINVMSQSKVAIIPEANSLHPNIKDRVLNRVKAITGGDPVHYNRKYKDGTDCSVWPFMFVQANEFPDFADSSGALANRVWPFPLTRTFAGKEDRGLAERLCKPESISGILNWALQGLVRVRLNNNNLTICDEAKSYIEDIRYDTFPLAAFVEEVCLLDPDAITYVDDLHEMYMVHTREHGSKYIMSTIKFSKMLDSSHLPIIKERESRPTEGNKRRYFFKGVRINEMSKKRSEKKFPPIAPPLPTPINNKIIK